ncbi:hypothetical protein H8A99_22080 [Bradyrhizobium sp. Arg68]|uniref:hypothetical protein n=1 Tax=Bradyrhizobium ivorense TaxID=2511166 RepID=UPI001E59D14D|nr:hypothetical protein [Bradyrhizobium ivorense]MCC8939089.1 hypothetical protein [Bradyrhizobium ivorense]
MVGYLKRDDSRYCVEYADRRVQVYWWPAAPEAIARAERWLGQALPRQEKVPETMLRTLIGYGAEFASVPIRGEREVEWHGKLSDGGAIKLVCFKQAPLNDDEYDDAINTLKTWVSSYFS